MGSLFDKNPSEPPPADGYSRHLIAGEIAHLKKPQGTRASPRERAVQAQTFFWVLGLALVAIYCADPFLHAYYKGDAIKAYPYLCSLGRGDEAQPLADSGILASDELMILKRQAASSGDLFSSPDSARAVSDKVVQYQKEMDALHSGHPEQLGEFNKLRYEIFYHFGLSTPRDWTFLDPKVSYVEPPQPVAPPEQYH